MESTIAGKYAVVEALGACPTGTRFTARHPLRESLVTVTVLPAHGDEAFAAVRRASELRHDALASVVDLGEDAGHRHVVEAIPEGEPLDRMLRDRGVLAAADALHIARHVATALVHAHADGVVHGRLTPASVVVRPEVPPRAWLTGLAAAQAVAPGTAHAAPEQARGAAPDARTDVFALGLVLFEMIEGKPFLPADAAARERLLAASEPLLPRFSRILPAGVSALVARAIRPAPAHRFQTMDAMREEIEGCLRRVGEQRIEATKRRRVVLADEDAAAPGEAAETPAAPAVHAPAPRPAAGRRAPSIPGRVLTAPPGRSRNRTRWMPIGGFVALAVLALGWPLVRSKAEVPASLVPAAAGPASPARRAEAVRSERAPIEVAGAGERPDVVRADVVRTDLVPVDVARAEAARAEPAVEPVAPAPARLAPEAPHAAPLANLPPRIVARTPRTDGPVRLMEGQAMRFAVAARDGNDDRLAYAWFVDGRRTRAGAALRWTAPLAATGTTHAVEAQVSDGTRTARVAWTVEVRPRMSETNVREWFARLAEAWDRKDVSTLHLFGVVRTADETAAVTKRFSRWGGYRVAVGEPAIRMDGRYASVVFEQSELDGRGRLLSSRREAYTLEKQADGFIGLRTW